MKKILFEAAPILAQLKDFQRRTVDAVFTRMYLDPVPALRFLVADEVGLGKTMVARGVIARALEHLQTEIDQVNIVYICSNAAIAAQNVGRLNVGEKEFARASRLTLLPTQVRKMKEHPVNFVSFTPGTTFDLQSSGGVVEERALLYQLLRGESWLDPDGLLSLLQCTAGWDNWRYHAQVEKLDIDPDLAKQFLKDLEGNESLRQRTMDLTLRFPRGAEPSRDDSAARYALVGDLRKQLASTCLDALQTDLVVLDEFQRFRHLLNGKDPAAELAQKLFNYPDVRLLLLSATPYRMLALDHEQDDDHYPDFIRTLEFLMRNRDEVKAVEADLQRLRRGLYSAAEGEDSDAAMARDAVERRLRQVMCRTERVGMTARRDAMLAEPPRPAPLLPGDLGQAALADRVAQALGAADTMEYWKSSPYLLSFLRHYELRKKLDKVSMAPPSKLLEALQAGKAHLLNRERIENHERVDPANARMRVLFEDTLERGLWRVLWLPPSMPYAAPGGAFAQAGEATKALVFSEWSAVPDAIAALCSYEAERRMLEGIGGEPGYSKLYEKLKQMLRFTRAHDGRLTGMPALALLLPSPWLADTVDPLRIALEEGGGTPVSQEQLVESARRILEPTIEQWAAKLPREGTADQRWYWAAPYVLGGGKNAGLLKVCEAWVRSAEMGGVEEEKSSEKESGLRAHLRFMVEAMSGKMEPPLGRPPADLAQVLAKLALAGPGTCTLRALKRVVSLPWSHGALLAAAWKVAHGFRTLFNLPESIALLRGASEEFYWLLVLAHGLDGNVQALLDEQIHVLLESLGAMQKPPEKQAEEIGAALAESLSLHTAQLRVDLVQEASPPKRIEVAPIQMRCRFALRFGDLRDDKDTTLARADTVRVAFNSPFRPFVLATTSIGQEGLDFHTWCHAVVHWNLPRNPVELEQREGRVHRYKGHAVRKNLVRRYGLMALHSSWNLQGDPWAWMFEVAVSERSTGASDIWPYWVFEVEGGARIERRVPLLPYSREVEKLRKLKRNLALYRLVFGQPRQEDLLTHLTERMSEEHAERVASSWAISLQPGGRSS